MVLEYRTEAERMGLALMEWQILAGRYMTALGSDDLWLYRRFGATVARQNGKTEIIKPRTLLGFRLGRRMLHIAQDRLRPRRSVFEPLADFVNTAENRDYYGIKTIRWANGQEQILCRNGASYTILAPTSGGARGGSFDDVFVDEAREFEDRTVDAIVRPTIAASRNPQISYFSSAGHEASALLNAIRDQRDTDPRLAYLEWSAEPGRTRDDRRGWAEANPALGVTITEETIEDELVSMADADFETERLNRWVPSMSPLLVDAATWQSRQGLLGRPVHPFMGVALDQSGKRAAAAVAWRLRDGTVALTLDVDATGAPIDVDLLGPQIKDRAGRLGIATTGYNDRTDKALIPYLRNPKAVSILEFAQASAEFRNRVDGGRLRWADADAIGQDLAFTSTRSTDAGGVLAVASSDSHPIPAAEAAIRAVWLAAAPRPGAPRVL